MNKRQLVFQSLKHYRRSNLGVVLGTLLATMVLTGALLVGDSVRHTLRHMAESRIGDVDYILSAGDRFVRTALADDLASQTNTETAPILMLAGVGSADGGQRRTGRIQVLGVDQRFWGLSGITDRTANTGYDGVVINPALAEQLELTVGDQWLLRLESQDWIPGDLPFAARESRSRSLRLVVTAIVERDSLGIFGLEPNQRDPLNCYLPLQRLAEEVERTDMANMLLIKGNTDVEELHSGLNAAFRLADGEFNIRKTGSQWEVNSQRVFLDTVIEEAAESLNPQSLLTYFVNSIRKDERSTPYSFIAGVESGGLEDDEIIITDWLAKDLNAKRGDVVDLNFWLPEA
ncbi:ABC transporter permease, partial [bacterium]|nr:ABC transporter permease [bacterium]